MHTVHTVQVRGHDSSLHMCGHTEEWTVVMGYLCIQPKWLLLMHIHTSNLHMSSLCSNPIVPEAATDTQTTANCKRHTAVHTATVCSSELIFKLKQHSHTPELANKAFKPGPGDTTWPPAPGEECPQCI